MSLRSQTHDQQIQLEPEVQAFAEAQALSSRLFTLGPQQGRLALDEAQSGMIPNPAVDVEDLTITNGPSAQVALRILRPKTRRRRYRSSCISMGLGGSSVVRRRMTDWCANSRSEPGLLSSSQCTGFVRR